MKTTMASSRYKALALFSIAAICVSLLFILFCHLLPFYPRLEAGGDDFVWPRWVIPIAGSSDCGNYRHQWDDCLSSQSDADLIYYWNKFLNSPEGSSKKLDAQKELLDILTHRVHVDNSINLIGKLHFGLEKDIQVLSAVPKTGHPFVDDWACLKSMIRIFKTHCGSLSEYGMKHIHSLANILQIRIFKTHCGSLSEYGMKHIHSLANICNAGISNETVAKVSAEVCSQIPSTRRSSLHRGFSA